VTYANFYWHLSLHRFLNYVFYWQVSTGPSSNTTSNLYWSTIQKNKYQALWTGAFLLPTMSVELAASQHATLSYKQFRWKLKTHLFSDQEHSTLCNSYLITYLPHSTGHLFALRQFDVCLFSCILWTPDSFSWRFRGRQRSHVAPHPHQLGRSGRMMKAPLWGSRQSPSCHAFSCIL